MVFGLAWRWVINRSVKKASRMGARVVMMALPGWLPGAGLPAPAVRGKRAGTRMLRKGRGVPGMWTASAGGRGHRHRRDTSPAKSPPRTSGVDHGLGVG